MFSQSILSKSSPQCMPTHPRASGPTMYSSRYWQMNNNPCYHVPCHVVHHSFQSLPYAQSLHKGGTPAPSLQPQTPRKQQGRGELAFPQCQCLLSDKEYESASTISLFIEKLGFKRSKLTFVT